MEEEKKIICSPTPAIKHKITIPPSEGLSRSFFKASRHPKRNQGQPMSFSGSQASFRNPNVPPSFQKPGVQMMLDFIIEIGVFIHSIDSLHLRLMFSCCHFSSFLR